MTQTEEKEDLLNRIRAEGYTPERVRWIWVKHVIYFTDTVENLITGERTPARFRAIRKGRKALVRLAEEGDK